MTAELLGQAQMSDFSKLAINQFTTLHQWSLPQAIEGYARNGVHAIGIVRDKLQEVGVTGAKRLLRAHDMTVTCICVGGLFTDVEEERFRANLNSTRRVIDEAAELNAECVVLVAGGLPEGSRDLPAARARCLEGLAEVLPYAKSCGVTLALEPLHPMICAFRSCLSTLGQANDWIEALGAGPELGIVVDVYHVWWDPDMEREIERAAGRIVSVPCVRLAVGYDRLAAGPGHDGRRCDRYTPHSTVGRGYGVRWISRGRDLFGAELVEARSGRGGCDRQGPLFVGRHLICSSYSQIPFGKGTEEGPLC